MGCCNQPATALETAALDPSQHVNYAKGMVLGVDDFTQEFAYLAGRDQWVTRDAIGYGTLSGLRILAELDGDKGMRLHVTAGSAAVPSGKLVCVPADQCAVINDWLAKPANAATVKRLLNPESPPLSPPMSPPSVTSGLVSLYLTLCYTDCKTRPVPVPGEPCRSDDKLMEDSRIADDFRLRLEAEPPAQYEEDAVRYFARWLRANVQVVDASPPTAGDESAWLEVLRSAAQPWLDLSAMSPPVSPSEPIPAPGEDLPELLPFDVDVPRGRLCDFLRMAFRFWGTELRPIWMARRCHRVVHKDGDCVLLARVELDVAWIGGSPTGVWQIAGSPAAMTIDETSRPSLSHLRLLQEWLLCGCECGGAGEGVAPGAPAPGTPFHQPATPVPAATSTNRDSGALRVPVLATSTDLALNETHYSVLCRGGPAITLTLPDSTPANAGRVFVIKNVNVANVTVNTNRAAGDLLDGDASVKVRHKRAMTVIADGEGGWHIIATVA